MTETMEQTNESQEQTETHEAASQQQAETTSQANEVQSQDKPEGWDQVEFSPDQQARFNRVYGQVKNLERTTKDYEKIMRDQYEIIEQLRQGQDKIVNHLQESNLAETESSLKSQRKEAYDRGDLMAVDDINDKLTELNLKKHLAALQKKEAPVQQKAFSGTDVVNMAVQSGQITPSDAEVYRAWANEVDDYGNLKRPWVNANDHRNAYAASEGRAVFTNPQNANKAFAEKLQEIDKRMGLVNKAATSNVLPAGNLTRGGKMGTVKLSAFQEKLAVRTNFAGRGKSPQEHIEAFRKQVAEMKGVR